MSRQLIAQKGFAPRFKLQKQFFCRLRFALATAAVLGIENRRQVFIKFFYKILIRYLKNLILPNLFCA